MSVPCGFYMLLVTMYFKDIIRAVRTETEFVDKDTGVSVHSNLGMFVLVLMSHGAYCTLAATDENSPTGDEIQIKLVDIYRLLSAQNFPAMKGKPKMIILQACSGGLSVLKISHTAIPLMFINLCLSVNIVWIKAAFIQLR